MPISHLIALLKRYSTVIIDYYSAIPEGNSFTLDEFFSKKDESILLYDFFEQIESEINFSISDDPYLEKLSSNWKALRRKIKKQGRSNCRKSLEIAQSIFELAEQLNPKISNPIPYHNPFYYTDLVVFEDEYLENLPMNGIQKTEFGKITETYNAIIKDQMCLKFKGDIFLKERILKLLKKLFTRPNSRYTLSIILEKYPKDRSISFIESNCFGVTSECDILIAGPLIKPIETVFEKNENFYLKKIHPWRSLLHELIHVAQPFFQQANLSEFQGTQKLNPDHRFSNDLEQLVITGKAKNISLPISENKAAQEFDLLPRWGHSDAIEPKQLYNSIHPIDKQFYPSIFRSKDVYHKSNYDRFLSFKLFRQPVLFLSEHGKIWDYWYNPYIKKEDLGKLAVKTLFTDKAWQSILKAKKKSEQLAFLCKYNDHACILELLLNQNVNIYQIKKTFKAFSKWSSVKPNSISSKIIAYLYAKIGTHEEASIRIDDYLTSDKLEALRNYKQKFYPIGFWNKNLKSKIKR